MGYERRSGQVKMGPCHNLLVDVHQQFALIVCIASSIDGAIKLPNQPIYPKKILINAFFFGAKTTKKGGGEAVS
jgi:hypothetical protein